MNPDYATLPENTTWYVTVYNHYYFKGGQDNLDIKYRVIITMTHLWYSQAATIMVPIPIVFGM